MRQCFAGLDALVPRVVKLDVTSTSAVSEPRTTVAAATDFLRFHNDTTFGAYRTDGRRRGYWRVYVDIGQNTNTKTRQQPLLGL